MGSEQSAEDRIAHVQATAPTFADARRDANIATVSRVGSIGTGAAIAARGGPVGLVAYAAGVGGGYAGSWLAKELGAPEFAAKAFEAAGFHRIGEGGPKAATVTNKVAHSFAFAGLIAGLVAGALVAAAIVVTGGAAAVVIVGAAAAGGTAAGFVGTTISGGLAQMGSRTGPISTGSPNTFIGGLPAARMTDTAACGKEPAPVAIVEGSQTIFVNRLPMVRVGHKLSCGATVDEGNNRNVFLDQTTGACAAAASEVPLWAQVAADWVVFLPWGKKMGKARAPQPALKASGKAERMGRIIGWGEGKTAEAVATTEAITQALTPRKVRAMINRGLTKEFVTDQLAKYNAAVRKGESKLKNINLLPRQALMSKILELWSE